MGIFVCSEAASKVGRYRLLSVGFDLSNVSDFFSPHFYLKRKCGKKDQERRNINYSDACVLASP